MLSSKNSPYQKILLSILVDFDKFCRENNIQYSLAYGTLLGAVRHQGFIPWDDDIDIFMLREDYNKFVELWNQSNQYPQYQFWGLYDPNNFFIGYIAKLFSIEHRITEITPNHQIHYGAYIDIFPVDNFPDDVVAQKKHLKKIKLIFKLLTHFYRHGVYLNRLASRYSKNIPSIYPLLALLKKTHNQFNQTQTSKRGASTTYSKDINQVVFDSNFFTHLQEIKFEDHYFYAFEDAEMWLEQYYGNFMQPPPKSLQKGHNLISENHHE